MPATTARYTIISADTHIGGSHAQYREYLDESSRVGLLAERRRLPLWAPSK